MRIVQIITASAIAFGSTTAAFAASPSVQFTPALYTVSQSAQVTPQDGQTAEIIQVSGKKHYKKYKRKHHKSHKVDRRHHNKHHAYYGKRHHDYDHHHRSKKKSDVKKILGLLGAASIIANSN